MEFIYIEQNSLPNDLCDEIIDFFNKSPEYTNPGVTISGVNLDIKKTTDLFIVKTRCSFEEKIDKILFEVLNKSIVQYVNINYDVYKNCNVGLDNLFDNGFQIQRYVINTDYYHTHNDFNLLIKNNNICFRVFTFIWYLNTVEKGGETEFLIKENPKIKPEKGKLVIFPSNITYPHRGCCPESSDKYIITGWLYSISNTPSKFPTRIKL